jgi:hypothetical protein
MVAGLHRFYCITSPLVIKHHNFDIGKNSRSQKLSTAKKNPPIWKKIVKFGSREKTTYTVVR